MTLSYDGGVLKLRRMMSEMPWHYDRTVSTVAVQAVAVITALLARALLPARWRPTRLWWVAPASAGAYVTIRAGAHTGWSKRFKHRVLDWLGGDVDDAQTWMLGMLSSGGILVVGQILRRSWAALLRKA
jgi:hypothetical protein